MNHDKDNSLLWSQPFRYKCIEVNLLQNLNSAYRYALFYPLLISWLSRPFTAPLLCMYHVCLFLFLSWVQITAGLPPTWWWICICDPRFSGNSFGRWGTEPRSLCSRLSFWVLHGPLSTATSSSLHMDPPPPGPLAQPHTDIWRLSTRLLPIKGHSLWVRSFPLRTCSSFSHIDPKRKLPQKFTVSYGNL